MNRIYNTPPSPAAPNEAEDDVSNLSTVKNALFGSDLSRLEARMQRLEEHLHAVIQNVADHVGQLETSFNQQIEIVRGELDQEKGDRDKDVQTLQLSVTGVQQIYSTAMAQAKEELIQTQADLRSEMRGMEASFEQTVENHRADVDVAMRGQLVNLNKGQEKLGDVLVGLGDQLKAHMA